MLNRLTGLILIINTLLPFLLAAGVLSFFAVARGPSRDLLAAVDSIRSEVGILDSTLITPARETIEARAESVKQRLATAGEVVAALQRSVAAGFRQLNLNVNFPRMPRIETFLGTIEIPQLPKIDLRIGDELAKPFRAIGGAIGYLFDVAGDFQQMVAAVRDVVKSEQVEHLKAHGRDVSKALGELATILRNALTAVKILLIIGVPWAALSYGLWARGRLARGWALLQGRTA